MNNNCTYNVIATIQHNHLIGYKEESGERIYEVRFEQRIFLEGFATPEQAERAADSAVRNNPGVVIKAFVAPAGEQILLRRLEIEQEESTLTVSWLTADGKNYFELIYTKTGGITFTHLTSRSNESEFIDAPAAEAKAAALAAGVDPLHERYWHDRAFNPADCGGAYDGVGTVYSAADPGL